MLPLLTTFSPPPCLNSLPKHSARETRCIRTSADAMKLERQVEIDMLRLSLQDGQSTTVPRHAGRIPSATKPPQYKFRRGHKNINDMPLHCLRVPLRRIHVYNLLPTALIKSFGYRLVSGVPPQRTNLTKHLRPYPCTPSTKHYRSFSCG